MVFSQRVMLALIDKGLTRDEAYKITQTASMESWNTGQDFRDLLRQNSDVAEHLYTLMNSKPSSTTPTTPAT